MLYTLFIRFFTNRAFEGWAALMMATLFMGGVQLISLGILGAYVGRIYQEIKRRPLYVVHEYCGFGDSGPSVNGSPAMKHY
jgi:dolichol-phosphate mannosyltransferase